MDREVEEFSTEVKHPVLKTFTNFSYGNMTSRCRSTSKALVYPRLTGSMISQTSPSQSLHTPEPHTLGQNIPGTLLPGVKAKAQLVEQQ
jgi:hypothetical protein